MEGQSARVHSIDTLRMFRIALIKFAEACGTALTDAESEMQRVVLWLEHDQISHWTSQVRKRTEDAQVSITISLLTGYAAFIPANAIGVSGVLAAVTDPLPGVAAGRVPPRPAPPL